MMRVGGNILQAKDRSQVLRVESFEESVSLQTDITAGYLQRRRGRKKDLLVHLLQKNQAVLERNMAPNWGGSPTLLDYKERSPKSSWFKTKNNYPIYENRLLCFTSNALCCVYMPDGKHTKCVKSPKAKMTIECHCLLFGGKKHSVCLMTTSNHSDFNGSTIRWLFHL